MTQENRADLGSMLLLFLAGAAVGAVAVALVTPKTGRELRADVRNAIRRAKLKASDFADGASEILGEAKERTTLAANDLKRGFTDAAKDLRG
jgi:gas vesicle protein